MPSPPQPIRRMDCTLQSNISHDFAIFHSCKAPLCMNFTAAGFACGYVLSLSTISEQIITFFVTRFPFISSRIVLATVRL